MAVAHNSNISIGKSCNCFTLPGLAAQILQSSENARLEDHYVLGDRLGWGRFGVIFVCTDVFTRELLACKSIPKDRLVTPEDVRSIKLEIEIMSSLSGHPNVVDLKAIYEDENHIHLVMELCAGGELYHRLEKNGHFSERNARVLFFHLMEVLSYCHDKGIVHRDLKPENILLTTKYPSSPIKLADFGLATHIKPGQSLSGTVGSPFYIAPEVLSGGYNQAADVWSAGVILYILLSGMPPFWGKTKSRIFNAVRAANLQFPSEPWKSISASAKDLIAGMLCRDPSRRLTATQVLGHSWMLKSTEEFCLGLPEPENLSNRGDLAAVDCSALSREFSFGFDSPAEENYSLCFAPPALSCKSSFSSLVFDASCPPLNNFSFHSCGDPCDVEFSVQITSFPSFSFFGPSSPKEIMLETSIQRESSFGELFSDTAGATRRPVEVTRGRTNGRPSTIHGRKYRTIGFGEQEQIDVMVIGSVIRWASCHLPGAASQRSSLVC